MKRSFTKKVTSYALAFAMLVTGSAAGSLADAGQAQAAKKVTVKFAKKSYTVTVGKTVKTEITAKNVKKVKSRKYTVGSKKIAKVTKTGAITGVKAGTTTLTCKVKYIKKGSSKAITKKVKTKIKVNAAKDTSSSATQAPSAATQTPSAATQAPAGSVTQAPAGNETETPAGEKVITGDVTKENTSLKMLYDDTTNISDTPVENYTPEGGTLSVTRKDNGVMRKDVTASYLAQNEMGTGINLGNTLEATYKGALKYDIIKGTDETKYDVAWGNAVTTQEYFDTLHSYGINTVRIPVAWSNGDSDDGTFTIDPKLLARVEEVANYALNNGMYVVINDHWDSGWWGGFGACTRDDDGYKVAYEERRAATWKRYESYWTQIANRFKDYSDHLILESANEELGNRLNDGIYPSTGYGWTNDSSEKAISGNLKADEKYETANKINQLFVDTIRKTGGNNANRHLLIAGYDTNMDATNNAKFVMPTDTEENGKDRLFLSVHYYTPWDFCGDGGTGEYTLEDKENTTQEFKECLTRWKEEGYPIIIGECGVCAPTGVTGSVTKWFENVFTDAREYFAVPCLWETGQYFDRRLCALKFKDVANFFNAVNVNAKGEYANGDTSMSGVTGKKDTNAMTIDVSQLTPVWKWDGHWYKNGGDSLVGADRYAENAETKGEKPEDFASGDVTTTIDGDTTSISFDATGYQSFLKLDMSKYKNPAIAFKFADETIDVKNWKAEDEDNVGRLQLGLNSEAGFAEDVGLAWADFEGRGVVLKEAGVIPTETKPYLSIAFSGRPTIEQIYIYEAPEN